MKKKKKIFSALQCYRTKELELGMDEHDHYAGSMSQEGS
jgi:hypothetical protein